MRTFSKPKNRKEAQKNDQRPLHACWYVFCEKATEKRNLTFSAKNFQPALRLALLLLYAGSSACMSTVAMTSMLSTLVVLLVIFGHNCLDLGGAPLDKNRMATDVLALHLLGGLEVVITVAETHKSIAFALGRSLVSDDSSFLNRREAREGLIEGFVGDFTGQVSNK